VSFAFWLFKKKKKKKEGLLRGRRQDIVEGEG
jgi:hypothetical protein